jgi:hypothetical protein
MNYIEHMGTNCSIITRDNNSSAAPRIKTRAFFIISCKRILSLKLKKKNIPLTLTNKKTFVHYETC